VAVEFVGRPAVIFGAALSGSGRHAPVPIEILADPHSVMLRPRQRAEAKASPRSLPARIAISGRCCMEEFNGYFTG